jgi:hypothetical protein
MFLIIDRFVDVVDTIVIHALVVVQIVHLTRGVQESNEL